MTRLAALRAAGKTPEAPIWNRATRRAYRKAASQQGEREMRRVRTATAQRKRR